ncbi:MAG: hypothetical protein H7Y11_10540, partial [Armatimonadetes bacterium]|nr:hypothetical protein [Anaerolineae bacterium]
QIVIAALNREIDRLQPGSQTLSKSFIHLPEPVPYPSDEAIEAAIQESMERVALGGPNLRVLGLNAGSMWMSDDFDDELPDEFWFGDDV